MTFQLYCTDPVQLHLPPFTTPYIPCRHCCQDLYIQACKNPCDFKHMYNCIYYTGNHFSDCALLSLLCMSPLLPSQYRHTCTCTCVSSYMCITCVHEYQNHIKIFTLFMYKSTETIASASIQRLI